MNLTLIVGGRRCLLEIYVKVHNRRVLAPLDNPCKVVRAVQAILI